MFGGKESVSHYNAAWPNGPGLRAGAPHGTIATLDLGFVKRRPLNYFSPIMAFLIPWIMFCLMLGLLSFPIHFENGGLINILVVVSLVMIILVGLWTYVEKEARRQHPFTNPSWFPFIFVSLSLAWILGVILGSVNYMVLLKPYMQTMTMNTYNNINPLLMRGEQLQDAGIVSFGNNSKIDISKAMGFKNYDMYCVAPISLEAPIEARERGATRLDFWAVDKNCCTSQGKQFKCEMFDIGGLSGVRLNSDIDRPFYRLAVQEAEALYGIKAKHPIFFHWMRNPLKNVEHKRTKAFKNFLRGVLAYGVFQLFLVALAIIRLSLL